MKDWIFGKWRSDGLYNLGGTYAMIEDMLDNKCSEIPRRVDVFSLLSGCLLSLSWLVEHEVEDA